MHEADKIRKLKAYAQAVLAALEAEPPVPEPGVERLFQGIRSAAEERPTVAPARRLAAAPAAAIR